MSYNSIHTGAEIDDAVTKVKNGLPITNGGTGANTLQTAKSNLEILNYEEITGEPEIDPIPISYGGTQSTTASGARANIGAAYGWEQKATTTATSGWYRIAMSAKSIANCIGTFHITGDVSGKHTNVALIASISYGVTDGVSLVQTVCSNWTSAALTMARIVYNTAYSGNYAYLEVYMPNAIATSISVKYTGTGWSPVAPSTAGSIPDGYISKEITFVNGNNIVGNLYGNVTSSSILLESEELETLWNELSGGNSN